MTTRRPRIGHLLSVHERPRGPDSIALIHPLGSMTTDPENACDHAESTGRLPHAWPRLTHEEFGFSTLTRRVLLHSASSHLSGVEIAFLVGGEPVHAPLAALACAERSPRIQEVSLGVVGEELVRSLIGGPQNTVVAHIDAVDVHRRARTEIPLVEELAILVEHLDAAVVAIVHVDSPRL